MPPVLTVSLAKIALSLSRALGRGGGSALPGLMAERIDPNIGHRLAEGLKSSIIVTGTNGKTTTSKMLAQILSDNGEQLVSNRAGSNLSRGVVSALIEHVGGSGRFHGETGLFEVDEAAMPAVAAMLQPQAIIVLNLFRDQLDRYGELDTTAKLIGKGIAATNATVYLNADDPLVASLAKYAKPQNVTYFGIDDVKSTKLAHDVTADSNTCPVCGRTLIYKQAYFGHIGRYRCRKGHFDRPEPTYAASHTELKPGGASFTLTNEADVTFSIQLPGLYNIYNALAAVSLALHRGTAAASAAQSLEHVQAAFGRVEKLEINGRNLYLLLVKNPTGFNQIIQTFLLREKQQNVLFCINDNFADGRDVSWLWDVAFEELLSQGHHLATSGIRASDMALRLKYGGMSTEDISPDLHTALNRFIAQVPEGGTGYIIPTYTAMLEARKLLSRQTKLKGIWQ